MKKRDLLDKVFVTKLKAGPLMLVKPRDHVQSDLFWYGVYEEKFASAWLSFIRPGMNIVDLGAQAGYYSILAASRGADVNVYAFDPVAEHIDQLEKSCTLNEFRNVHTFRFAVGETSADKTVFLADSENTGMTSLRKPENFGGQTRTVKMVSLDEWKIRNRIGQIHMIKIDTEGYEKNVIEGMQQLIVADQPILFVEVIDRLLTRFGSSADDLHQLLSTLGYTPFKVTGTGQLKKSEQAFEDELVVFLPAGFDLFKKPV